jgi:threonine dehydratase
LLTLEHIQAARQRISGQIIDTPLAPAHNLSESCGSTLFMKLENLQVTGSFKERGALNKLLTLSPEEQQRGIFAASAGNHAQGVARHATRLGLKSTIVMPEATPLLKVSRTRRFGADVVLHGAAYDESYVHAMTLCEEAGGVFVHPFDDLEVMAGQGTIGLEMVEKNPDLQTVVVPIGGGGLIAGIAVAIKAINPRIQVIGVQTEALPSMKAAMAAGHPVEVPMASTIADGIAVRKVGVLTLEAVERYVDDIVTVNEEEIASAILQLIEDERVVAEGAAGAGLAAVLYGRVPQCKDRTTGLVICGGNIDTNVISTIIERGLVKTGRRVRLEVVLPDQPGALARLTQKIAECRANIVEIHHERHGMILRFGETVVLASLETRGYDHVERLIAHLQSEGYSVRLESTWQNT